MCTYAGLEDMRTIAPHKEHNLVLHVGKVPRQPHILLEQGQILSRPSRNYPCYDLGAGCAVTCSPRSSLGVRQQAS